MTLLLTERDAQALLTMQIALEAVEEAFRGLALGSAVNLPRRRVYLERGTLHVMSAAVRSRRALGLKAYATFGGRTDFLIPLYDSDTGKLLALIEGDWLGRMRTGAASGVATKYLARPESNTLGLFGAGGQARTQLLAVCAVRPIERVMVYSRRPENRAAFIAEMQPQVSARLVEAASPQEAVEGAGVIVTMTSASLPVFDGEWVAPGTHVNAAGSNHLKRREIDGRTVGRAARVAADSVEQAKLESGDLAAAVAEGMLQWEDVVEMSDIVGGRVPGRTSPDEITLFESHGIAAWDVATAARVYELALQQGMGQQIPLFD